MSVVYYTSECGLLGESVLLCKCGLLGECFLLYEWFIIQVNVVYYTNEYYMSGLLHECGLLYERFIIQMSVVD